MTTIGSGIGIFGVVSSDISSLYMETQIILLACDIHGEMSLSSSETLVPTQATGDGQKGERRCFPVSLAQEIRFLLPTS